MRKFNIFLTAVLGLFAASCDDAPETAKPQENEPQPAITTGDVTVNPTIPATVDLEAAKEAGYINILTLGDTENLPEGSVTSYEFELSATENFEKVRTLPVDFSKGVGCVYAADWNAAHNAMFGRSLKPKKAYWRIPVYITVGGTKYRLGGTDYYAASGSVEETCFDTGFRVEEAYYLLSNGTTWDMAQAGNFKFNHSDLDPMDDPVFTMVIEVSEELAASGDYWKVAPKSAIDNSDWAAVLGTEVDGDTALTGTLILNGNAGKIDKAGKFRMTINIEASTYVIEEILHSDFVWTPGNGTSWFDSVEPQALPWLDAKQYFADVAILDGEFKFTSEHGWKGTNYGNGGAISHGDVCPLPFHSTYEGLMATAADAGNLTAGSRDLYWTVCDVYNMMWCAVPVTSLGVIGSLNDWGSQEPLAPVDGNLLLWSGDVEFPANAQWKFRINDTWDANFGGALDNLTFDGGNLTIEEAGTYTVTIDLSTQPHTATVTKK